MNPSILHKLLFPIPFKTKTKTRILLQYEANVFLKHMNWVFKD